MKIVLYTPDFEPITILELPIWLLEQMEKNGGARVAVSLPPNLEDVVADTEYNEPEIVTIICQKLKWLDGTLKPILITPHDELALTLRPDWLPGQVQAIHRYKDIIRELQTQLIKLGRQL
jgi:hypothetical protein